MRKLKLGVGFYIAMLIALLCLIVLIFVFNQERYVDLTCIAIKSNQQEIAKKYVDNVLFIDFCGSNGETMLMAACSAGNGEMIDYLLNKGADVNYSPRGKLTPLELFCKNGYLAGKNVLYGLIRAGAKQSNYVEKPAVFHLSDSFKAMTNEQKSIATEEVILLLQYGSPMKYNNTSLLHLAAESQMDDLFYTIVHTTSGLQLMTMRDGDGNTPWDVAVKSCSSGIQRIIRSLEQEYEDSKQENR